MLYAMEARAYANMGEVNKCHRAAKMALETFGEVNPAQEQDPDWIRFFTEAELNAENAHSYRDLAYVAGRSPMYASLAQPAMERAVGLFREQGTQRRSLALNLIGMSTVHLLQKNPEEAVIAAAEAAGIAERIRSERVNTRLRRTVASAMEQFGHVAQVREFSDVLASRSPEHLEAQAV